MKKILLLTAALLLGFLARSQEADNLGTGYAEVSFVARAEFSNDPETNHLGGSSFYAILDGAFNSNLSYFVQAHLLSCTPTDLYTSTLYSDSTNWLDYAYLNYDFGQLDLTVGKQALCVGKSEMQGDDYDVFWEDASILWLELPSYQWGATLNWTPADESFYLQAQVATSPFGERPFKSGQFSYSLLYCSTFREHFQDMYSFNMLQMEDGYFLKLFNVGLDFNYGDWNFGFDGTIDFFTFRLPNSKTFYANYTLSDKLTLGAKFGLDNMNEDFTWSTNRWYGGLRALWFPVESLRVHALAGYDTLMESMTFNLGATWKISL